MNLLVIPLWNRVDHLCNGRFCELSTYASSIQAISLYVLQFMGWERIRGVSIHLVRVDMLRELMYKVHKKCSQIVTLSFSQDSVEKEKKTMPPYRLYSGCLLCPLNAVFSFKALKHNLALKNYLRKKLRNVRVF